MKFSEKALPIDVLFLEMIVKTVEVIFSSLSLFFCLPENFPAVLESLNTVSVSVIFKFLKTEKLVGGWTWAPYCSVQCQSISQPPSYNMCHMWLQKME